MNNEANPTEAVQAAARELHTTNPFEQEVERALIAANYEYMTDHDGSNPARLDFYLPSVDVHIEVKTMHSERISEQMSRAKNVIVAQGAGAITLLAAIISKHCSTEVADENKESVNADNPAVAEARRNLRMAIERGMRKCYEEHVDCECSNDDELCEHEMRILVDNVVAEISATQSTVSPRNLREILEHARALVADQDYSVRDAIYAVAPNGEADGIAVKAIQDAGGLLYAVDTKKNVLAVFDKAIARESTVSEPDRDTTWRKWNCRKCGKSIPIPSYCQECWDTLRESEDVNK